jgi:type IV secretory pathway VirD2 relaxase
MLSIQYEKSLVVLQTEVRGMEEYFDRKGAESIVSSYLDNEMMEYRKNTEREIGTNIAPEAKEAFNRKPYGNYVTIGFKRSATRPVIRAHA